jgi:DNA-binding NarL/FixJ family response regulator
MASSDATSADAAAWAPLSARERDVAILAARGLSNRRIAEALALSELAVADHVHSAFVRLGLESRTELAMWVAGDPVRRADAGLG